MTETTQMHNTTVENNNTGGVKMEPPVSPSPSEQQYSLKWNDFQQSILSSFRHLRDEEDFVDVTLACDQKSFTAHKVVLSACSPYFRKLLKANPCEHPIVILRDVRAEDVESLLRFMYNGEVHIGHEQLSDFLKTAQLLQVRGLADVTGPTGNNNNSSSNNNNLHGNPISTSTITPTSNSSSSLIPGTHISRTLNSQINASLSTPGVQELKASPTSTSLPWDIPSSEERSNQNTPNPPPQKRVKSAELYRVQHGLSPERLREHLSPLTQHPLHRSRDREMDRDVLHRNRDRSRESRDHSLELRESLLGQALEGGPTLIVPSSQSHPDLASIQAQSTGEDSNSSDASDRGDLDDGPMDGMNGSMDHPRTPTFPGAFLGLQGIPGLLPGPSGMHGADNFGAADSKNSPTYEMIRMLGAHMHHQQQQNSSETAPLSSSPESSSMATNAQEFNDASIQYGNFIHTGPQCPHCGKVYSNASNLRQHVRNVHVAVDKSLWHGCTTCDVQHDLIPATSIKKEIEDRYSPASSLSISSCLSATPQSGPAALLQLNQQQQTQRQLTARLFLTSQHTNSFVTQGGVGGGNNSSNNIGMSYGIGDLGCVSRRSLEMRVRATDPRPCPKCGKIYRSAHTLRTHLEDKHTVCPGYRCVLCGTVAKSRNSLHSHMSRQHRGISTKDLPVLPMPSPFDPDLASRLLAKAGVKISPAELRARASPTSGTRRSDIKLEMRQPGDDDNLDDLEDNDPEDLTMAGGTNNNNNGGGRYHDGLMGLTSPFNHPGTTISRIRPNAMTPKNMEQMNKDGGGSGGATGSAILDTYLQFITENAFNMGMSQEQAAAAMHAAKLAQLGAMGHSIDKLSPGMLPPQFDLSKMDSQQQHHQHDKQNLLSSASVTIEPKPKLNSQQQQQQHQQQLPDRIDIRRNDSPEPMDLGHETLQSNNNLRDDNKMMNRTNSGGSSNNNNASDTITSSGDEANYSDDDRIGSS